VDLTGTLNDLQALATALGYPYLHVPPVTNVFDTSLRVVFISRFPFLTTDTVHSPVDAKDMTRLHPVVKVDVPGTNNDPLLASVHLKSGTLLADRFQRALANGAADRMQMELVTAGGTIPLSALTFTASPSPGAGNIRLSAMAQGLSIPAGSSLELRVPFVPGNNGPPAPSDVFVNESHYDNTGTDTDEFVEIVVGPGFNGNLSEVSLVLYNGSNGQTYGMHALNTFTPGTVTASGHRLLHKMISGIQNDMDGFAVVAGSTVLHFRSYEGAFAATNGPASGMTSANVGISQETTASAGESLLGLVGSGGSGVDFTWTKLSGIAHSPGQPNSGQGDADETAFGTNPLNHASRFAPVIAKNVSGLELSFQGAAGVHYTVEYGESLVNWEELTTVIGEGHPVMVPLPMVAPKMFFRVRAGGPGF
jgi:hypothetical protein